MDISPTQAKAELAKRELARRQLRWFLKYNFEGYRENWHHKLIMDALERVERGELRKLMIFVPPRHGKSEIASINFPAWYFGRNPKKNIIAASYNSDLAVGFGRKARNIVSSAEYRNLFSGVSLAEDSQAAGRWITNQGGEYTAVGIGGGTTGRGADILLIDDPVKDKQEAESPVIQERNIGWYRSVARTRLSPQGAIVIIQTRWHDKDLAGMILAEQHDWEIIELPAIAESDDEFRKTGEALWPAQYSVEELRSIEADAGTELFSALYQQSPISYKSQVFKKSLFKYRTLANVEELMTRNFVTIDPAPGKSESADFIGVCVNYVDSENKWNVKAYRVKFDSSALIQLLFKLYADTHFEKVGIEKGMYKDVLKPFLDAEMITRNVFFTVVELDHGQRSKELRIHGLKPRYEAGGIYHIEGYCKDLEEELLRFPKSAHDDVMDAEAYQLQIAEPPSGIDEERAVTDNRDARRNSQRDSGVY